MQQRLSPGRVSRANERNDNAVFGQKMRELLFKFTKSWLMVIRLAQYPEVNQYGTVPGIFPDPLQQALVLGQSLAWLVEAIFVGRRRAASVIKIHYVFQEPGARRVENINPPRIQLQHKDAALRQRVG